MLGNRQNDQGGKDLEGKAVNGVELSRSRVDTESLPSSAALPLEN